MAGCCEQGVEFSGSIKCGKLLISEAISAAKGGLWSHSRNSDPVACTSGSKERSVRSKSGRLAPAPARKLDYTKVQVKANTHIIGLVRDVWDILHCCYVNCIVFVFML